VLATDNHALKGRVSGFFWISFAILFFRLQRDDRLLLNSTGDAYYRAHIEELSGIDIETKIARLVDQDFPLHPQLLDSYQIRLSIWINRCALATTSFVELWTLPQPLRAQFLPLEVTETSTRATPNTELSNTRTKNDCEVPGRRL
jgi:hypothetical protein